MTNPTARLQKRESAPKISILQKPVAQVTQLRLAHVQQLQSDIADLHRQYTKHYSRLRKDILKGIPVEIGPIRAFIRRTNGKKMLVVK